MIEKTLILTVGLPRSGKSTWARNSGFPVVSCDAIRQAMGVYPFVPAAERMVWDMAHYMVKALFHAGHPVVVLDSCSNTRKRRDEWKSKEWVRTFLPFDTPASICVQRAMDTCKGYLVPVIERMVGEFEPISADEVDP